MFGAIQTPLFPKSFSLDHQGAVPIIDIEAMENSDPETSATPTVNSLEQMYTPEELQYVPVKRIGKKRTEAQPQEPRKADEEHVGKGSGEDHYLSVKANHLRKTSTPVTMLPKIQDERSRKVI